MRKIRDRPTAQDGDGYTVSVTVSPIAAVAQAAQNDYPALRRMRQTALPPGELDKSSQSFKDWWAKSICGMVSARLASPGIPLAAQTVSVTLAKNDGGAYGFAGTRPFGC